MQCYVGAETFFFAKGDGVADLNLAAGIARHRACRRLATVAAVLLAALAALVGQGEVFFEGLVKLASNKRVQINAIDYERLKGCM